MDRKWIKMDDNGWKLMKMDEDGWTWIREGHLWKFQQKRISEYIRINKFTRMNVRTYSYKFVYTNECRNKYSPCKLYEYSNIFEYSSSFCTLTHSLTNVRIHLWKKNWYRRINIHDQYIQIFEYLNIFVTLWHGWPKMKVD